jgi:uncharacterized protein (TIGR02231 family)
VAEVTLLEDRALVQRRGRVILPVGRGRLTLLGVAPVLVDKTLAVRLEATSPEEALPEGVRARDVKVARRWITQDADRPEEVAKVAAAIRDKEAERDAMQHRIGGLEGEAAALADLAGLLATEISEDVAWGRDDLVAARAQLDDVDSKIVALGQASCVLEPQLRAIERDLSDLRTQAAARTQVASEATASLTIELVNSTEAPVEAELVVDYLVPGALWRPWHTAHLHETPESASIEVRTDGCVWQATGEDWTDVELRFSTERPSLGVAPPALQTDELYARKRGSAVQVEAREEQVHTAGLGADAVATEVDDELPGIDDGGDAIELKGRTRATIPGDGRPHRVAIGSFEAPAETAWICTPELVSAVTLRSRQTNRGERALLAGPVDLIRRGGLVGRTSITFVAPSERFDLGWGPDRALRVSREVEFLEVERKTLSSWTRKPRRVTLKLSNLDPAPRTVEVKERVAVSELEKVEVEVDHASQGAAPDGDGFVTWNVELRGFAHHELELKWTLVVHDDVVGL